MSKMTEKEVFKARLQTLSNQTHYLTAKSGIFKIFIVLKNKEQKIYHLIISDIEEDIIFCQKDALENDLVKIFYLIKDSFLFVTRHAPPEYEDEKGDK